MFIKKRVGKIGFRFLLGFSIVSCSSSSGYLPMSTDPVVGMAIGLYGVIRSFFYPKKVEPKLEPLNKDSSFFRLYEKRMKKCFATISFDNFPKKYLPLNVNIIDIQQRKSDLNFIVNLSVVYTKDSSSSVCWGLLYPSFKSKADATEFFLKEACSSQKKIMSEELIKLVQWEIIRNCDL